MGQLRGEERKLGPWIPGEVQGQAEQWQGTFQQSGCEEDEEGEGTGGGGKAGRGGSDSSEER